MDDNLTWSEDSRGHEQVWQRTGVRMDGSHQPEDAYRKYVECVPSEEMEESLNRMGSYMGQDAGGSFYPSIGMYGMHREFNTYAMGDMFPFPSKYSDVTRLMKALRSKPDSTSVWGWASTIARHVGSLQRAELMSLMKSHDDVPLTVCNWTMGDEVYDGDMPGKPMSVASGVVSEILNSCLVDLSIEHSSDAIEMLNRRFSPNTTVLCRISARDACPCHVMRSCVLVR